MSLPITEAANAFPQVWSNKANWLRAPSYYIPKTPCYKYIWNYRDFDAILLAISYILSFAI